MVKKVTPAPDAAITPSSGNVFTDMGFPAGEAAVMGLRAEVGEVQP